VERVIHQALLKPVNASIPYTIYDELTVITSGYASMVEKIGLQVTAI
jgi:hypothetical protein